MAEGAAAALKAYYPDVTTEIEIREYSPEEAVASGGGLLFV